MALLALTLSALALGIVEGPAWGWTCSASRPFRAANLALLAFSVAFFAQVLAGILLLTHVWRYDLLHVALAITPTRWWRRSWPRRPAAW